MKYSYWIFLLFLSVGMFACKGSKGTTQAPKTESRYDAMAKDMCACMGDFLELVDKLNAFSESGDTEGLMALMPQLEAESQKVEPCVQELETKYPEMQEDNPAEEEKVKASLKEHCPKMYKLLEEQEEG